MKEFIDALLEWIRLWHGGHDDTCDVKRALDDYDRGAINIIHLINIVDETDDSWVESFWSYFDNRDLFTVDLIVGLIKYKMAVDYAIEELRGWNPDSEAVIEIEQIIAS